MERAEISRHEVLVYQALATGEWKTAKEIAESSGVAPRTARAHALRLSRLGVLDQAEVFPAHRYKLSEHAANRNRSYIERLLRAAEVLGIQLPSNGRKVRQ